MLLCHTIFKCATYRLRTCPLLRSQVDEAVALESQVRADLHACSTCCPRVKGIGIRTWHADTGSARTMLVPATQTIKNMIEDTVSSCAVCCQISMAHDHELRPLRGGSNDAALRRAMTRPSLCPTSPGASWQRCGAGKASCRQHSQLMVFLIQLACACAAGD